jgi:hypothetical protein
MPQGDVNDHLEVFEHVDKIKSLGAVQRGSGEMTLTVK